MLRRATRLPLTTAFRSLEFYRCLFKVVFGGRFMWGMTEGKSMDLLGTFSHVNEANLDTELQPQTGRY